MHKRNSQGIKHGKFFVNFLNMNIYLNLILLCLISLSTSCQTQRNKINNENMEKASFGAGCFWGVEETFRKSKGVVDTKVGYMGGNTQKPSYKEVCRGNTGHAEVVEITFDPTIISYDSLLAIFWKCHNPTTLNYQGPDYGSQYRSVIFYYNDQQKKMAEESKDRLNKSGAYSSPIVTFIEEAADFWQAEEYHQRYYEKNGIKSCNYPY
jgi:peptide-methionine (S)-S-oxide reductase